MVDPFEGAQWNGLRRGDRLWHPRIRECEFMRHDANRRRIEVVDVYGTIRYVPEDESESLLRREKEH